MIKTEQVLEDLIGRYNDKKFPFYSLIGLKNQYGEDVVGNLNELREQGYIRRVEGANEPLVYLLTQKLRDDNKLKP